MSEDLNPDRLAEIVDEYNGADRDRFFEAIFEKMSADYVVTKARRYCEGFDKVVAELVTDEEIEVDLRQLDPELPDGFEEDAEHLSELIVAGGAREAIDLLRRMAGENLVRDFNAIARMLAARNAPARPPSAIAVAKMRLERAQADEFPRLRHRR